MVCILWGVCFPLSIDWGHRETAICPKRECGGLLLSQYEIEREELAFVSDCHLPLLINRRWYSVRNEQKYRERLKSVHI